MICLKKIFFLFLRGKQNVMKLNMNCFVIFMFIIIKLNEYFSDGF